MRPRRIKWPCGLRVFPGWRALSVANHPSSITAARCRVECCPISIVLYNPNNSKYNTCLDKCMQLARGPWWMIKMVPKIPMWWRSGRMGNRRVSFVMWMRVGGWDFIHLMSGEDIISRAAKPASSCSPVVAFLLLFSVRLFSPEGAGAQLVGLSCTYLPKVGSDDRRSDAYLSVCLPAMHVYEKC